jgi:CRISPR-associated RAMP protein (TIGR02581 family)
MLQVVQWEKRMKTQSIKSFAALRNRLKITGTITSQTALRIGSGRSNDVTGNDLPVLRDSRRRPFIPGASLKGAFRARMEALIRTVAPKQALDLQEHEDHLRGKIREIRQEITPKLAASTNRHELENDYSEQVWKSSTMIDLTFGAGWTAGRVFFKDALVDPNLWFDQYEVRNGVAINRDTETVNANMLYDYEVVPAGTSFQFELNAENLEEWQLGMILLGLRPWTQGDAQIGGFRSRGLGYIQLFGAQVQFTEIQNVDDILALLGHGESEHKYQQSLEQIFADKESPARTWFEAFKQKLSDAHAKEGNNA